MPDIWLTILNSVVFYRPTVAGTWSTNHDLNALAGQPLAGQQLVGLTADQFARFKNGGKRLPSRAAINKDVQRSGLSNPAGANITAAVPAAVAGAIPTPAPVGAVAASAGPLAGTVAYRTRADRSQDTVKIGDVGRYKREPGGPHATMAPPPPPAPPNPLIKPKLCGDLQYPVDASVRALKVERDHINSQAALIHRASALGAGPYVGAPKSRIAAEGLTIAIPHGIHAGGYTFGGKQMKRDMVVPGGAILKRKIGCAQFPALGMLHEFTAELDQFERQGQLTCEIVGSYRFLYRVSAAWTYVNPSAALDNLLLGFLSRAQ